LDAVIVAGLAEKEGESVRLFVGELPVILPLVHQYVRNAESLAILTRDNKQAAKARSVSGDAKTELWDEFLDKDRHRERLFRAIAQAAHHGQLNDFSNGIKGIEKAIRLRNRKARNPFTGEAEITKLQRRGLAVSLAELVVNEYVSLRRSKLLKVYNRCRDVISRYVNGLTLKRSIRGKFHNFAKNTLFGDLIDSVPLDKDDIRLVRNIHQAKSTEFDSVLILFDQERLMHVLEPDKFKSEEERRVTYVGLSRARNKLFIGIPQLSDVAEEKLREKLTIEVIRAS
jgi:DNA helicase-2/ATP-dependent DNA helicase PcrA